MWSTVKIFHSSFKKEIFVLEHETLQNCAQARLIQLGAYPGQQAGQPVSDTPPQAYSSHAGSAPEELACPNHKCPVRT